jgi:hypothetical protein
MSSCLSVGILGMHHHGNLPLTFLKIVWWLAWEVTGNKSSSISTYWALTVPLLNSEMSMNYFIIVLLFFFFLVWFLWQISLCCPSSPQPPILQWSSCLSLSASQVVGTMSMYHHTHVSCSFEAFCSTSDKDHCSRSFHLFFLWWYLSQWVRESMYIFAAYWWLLLWGAPTAQVKTPSFT